jgi:hypothetical protein
VDGRGQHDDVRLLHFLLHVRPGPKGEILRAVVNRRELRIPFHKKLIHSHVLSPILPASGPFSGQEEHVMKAIMNICDRIMVLHHGKKIAEGTPEEVERNPEVRRVYLGES